MMRFCVCLLLLLHIHSLYAACSKHMGLVTINEISKDHNWRNDATDFIEVKKLDNQLSDALVNTWTIEICESFLIFFQSCTGPVDFSTLQRTGKYWLFSGDPEPAEYIDWNFGFDVVIRDENDAVVDYVAANGVDYQFENCNYPYDTELSSGLFTRRAKRQPDGAGDWEVPPVNSQTATPAESNDGLVPPPGSPDLFFAEDITVSQGQDAVFTLKLSGPPLTDIEIRYSTYNGTGTAGTHYTSTTGTLTMTSASAATEATILVPTLVTGDTQDQTFYLVIESATNVNVIDQLAIATISPAGAVDHFSIIHAGQAANCEPATITIRAEDATGDLVENYAGTLALTTSTGHGDWSNISANGAFVIGARDSGNASIDFDPLDKGQIVLALNNSHAETLSINVEDDSNITERSNAAGADDDPDLVFSESSFKFLYGAGASLTNEIVAPQVASRPFATGLGYEPLQLRAITTDTSTGACTGLFTGNVTVDLALQCVDATSCSSISGSDYTIGGNAIAENSSTVVTQFTSLTLNFSSNGTADLAAAYADAGRVRLHARYALSGNTIQGSSQPIDVMPAGFCLLPSDSNYVCAGPNYWECSVFKQAGAPFAIDVSARGWQIDGDTDMCDNPDVLPGFNGNITLAPLLISPLNGHLGQLSANTLSLNQGQYSGAISWSEVGALSIQMGGDDYLSGSLPTNSSNTVGRFIPYELFITTKGDGTFADAQTGFSYVGQVDGLGDGAIRYDEEPWVDFVARGVQGNTLQNYLIGSFFKPPVPDIQVSSATLGTDGLTPLTVSSGLTAPDFVYTETTHTYRMTLSVNDHYLFDRDANAMIAPFTNDIALELSGLVDSDNVSAANSETLTPVGGNIRYGRLVMDNAYGPETEPINQAWSVEYFDGTRFILNTLDVDTPIDATNLLPSSVTITDVGDAANPLQVGDSTLSGNTLTDFGKAYLQWSQPVNNRYGSFEFEYEAPDWLKYYWRSTLAENPQAVINFGRYRGHDNMIYWKEITY